MYLDGTKGSALGRVAFISGIIEERARPGLNARGSAMIDPASLLSTGPSSIDCARGLALARRLVDAGA
jgi:hypothetical protein